MLTFNVVNMIAGICFIAYCAWILCEMGKESKKEVKKVEKKEEIKE